MCIMVKRVSVLLLALFFTSVSSLAYAAKTPPIRTSASNQVPICVTPDRLMSYLKKRNKNLRSKFNTIAEHYRQHGQNLGIRWDYAFFQMIVETNWLRFHAPNGRKGDVAFNQNNFAGLGATGGGVAGEKFANVSTGVLAHLQHIQMYSGKRVENPVANRTRKVQKWLLPWAQGFKRPVTYTDLTKKWSPTDRGYSNDIESVAKSFRKSHCSKAELYAQAKPKTKISSSQSRSRTASLGQLKPDTKSTVTTTSREQKTAIIVPKSNDLLPKRCEVYTASYGGNKAILIRSISGNTTNYHALGVHSDIESNEADAFIDKWARGGQKIGSFKNQEEALVKAFQLCRES